MRFGIFKLLAVLFFFISCKSTDTYDTSSTDDVIRAFENQKRKAIQRDISYLPEWQRKVEFEGSYYIPLKTDKRVYSFNEDNVKYSLDGKIWLKAGKQGEDWTFSILTVLPNNPSKNSESGIFLYEDWKTGKLNYQGYIENKLFNSGSYSHTVRLKGYVKKANIRPTCKTVWTETCAGEGSDQVCTTKSAQVCGDDDMGGGMGGGTGGTGGNDGTGETGTSHGGGGGGGVPPVIPPDTPSEEDKEIIDSLQGYPCAQEVLKKLPNLENRISNWLISVFKNSIENNITFRVSTKLDSKVDAVWNNNNAIGSTQTISLNADMLSKASQEYIAATMFHEALHGYLFLEKKRLEAEGKASQFGILYPGFSEVSINGQPRFVKKHQDFGTQLNDLAAAIRTFAPTLSEYDAMALAKGGVVSDMSSVEKSANYNHREGNAGTRCTTK